MIQLVRPPIPKGFPSPRIRKLRKAARDAIANAEAPTFPAAWKRYKRHFTHAQHLKCGFCEEKLTGSFPVMEHYAPKAGVEALLAVGSEIAGSNDTKGRLFGPLHLTGYWWRAYSWHNWLVACERCNTTWKRCLFPLDVPLGGTEPTPAPVDADAEDSPEIGAAFPALLLNPFDQDDPLDHLDFDEIGQVRARDRSARGIATIEVCGLDRESLRNDRERVADETAAWCEVLLANESTPADKDRAVRRINKLRSDDAPFAGTARATLRRLLTP